LTLPAARPEPGPASLDLSIVVPVYNEEENLPLLWPEIREVLEPTGLRYEVIFVDDGSRDRSAEIVREFSGAGPGACGSWRLKANAGETAATDAGLNAVRGSPRVVMDADLQNDPHDIPAMLKQLRPVGRGDRLAREPGRRRFVGATALVAHRQPGAQPTERGDHPGQRVHLSGLPRECLRDLVSTRGFIGSFRHFSGCAASGCSRWPVNHRPRRFGQSKYGIGNRAVRAFVDLLVVRWMKDRLLRYEIAEDLGASRAARG